MPLILEVALPVPLDAIFDYLPHPHTAHFRQALGCRVQVSFGQRKLIGVIVGHKQASDISPAKIKPIEHLLDLDPILDPGWLAKIRWCARYYHHPLGDTLFSCLPTLLKKGEPADALQDQIWFTTYLGQQIEAMPKTPAQWRLLQMLRQHPHGLEVSAISAQGFQSTQLHKLRDKGLIDYRQEPKLTAQVSGPLLAEAELVLTPEQTSAVQHIQQAQGFHVFLLEGVTGSGKTEVYLQALRPVLARGQQVLVLVPEISLTPQTLHRFRRRFACSLVALHSGLSERERLEAWLAAKRGAAAIVIGTRSAVFTPFANLGMVIIDEEQDASFKQMEGLRYHARDLALKYAQEAQVPVILGSATPSLESLRHALAQHYQHLQLTQRPQTNKPTPPPLQLLDIRSLKLQEGFSLPLLKRLDTHLQAGNQVLIFINRRGFAPALTCYTCGWLAECPQCDARMTWHKEPPRLHCHHCDTQQAVMLTCPHCQSEDLHPLGWGTQRSEAFLQQRYPEIPLVRLDRDAVSTHKRLQTSLQQIQQMQAGILLGTQMLAKGHHFPRVTLVAVLDADTGLYSSDFRALEHSGQLLTQVAGRAGRAHQAGEVILQTRHPDDTNLLELCQHGYSYFARRLLEEREQLSLPPYEYLAILHASGKTREQVHQVLTEMAAHLHPYIQATRGVEEADSLIQAQGLNAIGPFPAPMERRKNRYHMQFWLQAAQRAPLHETIAASLRYLRQHKQARTIRYAWDIDPWDTLG
ncbi:replication restart DNA helicase PriA [Allopseudospirillum japonicum]|uniref:Replication restart protein PriA n=1 Tax=Allopseudospirillum japonicum TaxID=64971 RepID=A0A1H6RE02_9GAMM|nr:primosomal protein N' [Allopseudospirillum japonicum]SEI51474.1 replication restart DNA helicase PriA [Allopseudospirillum japonicum]